MATIVESFLNTQTKAPTSTADDAPATHRKWRQTQILLADPANVTVRVRNGIVTLAGQLGSAEQHDLIRVAVRMTWDIDGAVNVVNKLGAIQPITPSNLP